MGSGTPSASWPDRLARLSLWAGLAAAFLLPIDGRVIPIPLALCIISGLLARPRWSDLWKQPLLLILSLFYLLHLLGMAWTQDTDFGLFDLQVKASLVLLPLAVSAWRDGDAFRKAMMAMTAGLVLAFCMGLFFAAQCLLEHGWIECWTQSYLSPLVHPSYQAWYAVWALGWWALDGSGAEADGRSRAFRSVAMVILLLYAIMLASKAGLITLLVLGVLIAVRTRSTWTWKVGGPVLAGLVATGLFLGPTMWHRVREARDAIIEWRVAGIDATAKEPGGSSERLITWSCSAECLKSAPYGAGTGDIKHALFACYDAHDAIFARERQLNSHSQFLQGGVALGWPGLLAALALALVPLWLSIRDQRTDLLLFALLFLVNAAVESVLEVQGGVVFFGLFMGLFAGQRSSRP